MRFERNRAELRDPAKRQQTKANEVTWIRQQAESEGALQELHLSEEQLNRLYALAAEWSVQSEETDAPSRSSSPFDENPLIAAELGSEVAQKWARYQRESSGRFRVRELAGVMASEEAPLTADQRRQLIGLYTTADEEWVREVQVQDKGLQPPTSEAEAIELHPGNKERELQYRQRLIDRAAPILSARQLDILRHDFEHQAAARELEWERHRSRGDLVQIDSDGCVTSYHP